MIFPRVLIRSLLLGGSTGVAVNLFVQLFGAHYMLTNGLTVPPGPGHEPSQLVHGVLNTTKTDSEHVSVKKSQVAANHERPEAPKPAAETESPAERATEHPPGAAVAGSEAQVPVEATGALKEPPDAKPVPQTGEKRDLDSTATPAPAPAPETVSEDKDKPAPEKTDEPDTKKQKTEPEPAQEPPQDTTGPAPAAPADAPTSEGPKKAARPKKEKVKEAVKKVIPTEGIGSRTRSRTKAT